jgi:GTP-binding protein HflX
MKLIETHKTETALIVGIGSSARNRIQTGEHLDELRLLAETAGLEIRRKIIQERDKIDPATMIGKGKAEEIGQIVEAEKIDTVIFDDDLSPVQVRNLEKYIKCKILDRSTLILDIFASRAKSKESMTQVELAQLQYLLPRLTRQWTHLSKQFSGVGMKGPGEQQIETDRRAIRTRISNLKKRLLVIEKEREVQRKGRTEQIRVALVGYTNVGKSTLMKLLSGSDVVVENRLFATLDTTVRTVPLSPEESVLLSDTVGFIRKLPPHLIASFRSTLAEASEADVILHIIDISHPRYEEQISVVRDTLRILGADTKPTIHVFNKIDLLSDREIFNEIQKQYEPSVFISAERGINITTLKKELLNIIESNTTEHILTLPQSEYALVAKLHEFAEIIKTEYEGNDVKIKFRINRKKFGQLQKLFGKNFSAKLKKWETKHNFHRERKQHQT